MSDDPSIIAKVVQPLEETGKDMAEDVKMEMGEWGKEVWDSIMSPKNPQEAAEARQRETEIKKKDAENAAAWRRQLAELARQNQFNQALARKNQQKQQVAVQKTKEKQQITQIKQAESKKVINQGVYDAERRSEIKGKVVA